MRHRKRRLMRQVASPASEDSTISMRSANDVIAAIFRSFFMTENKRNKANRKLIRLYEIVKVLRLSDIQQLSVISGVQPEVGVGPDITTNRQGKISEWSFAFPSAR
jgi:hypothetical protein